MSNLLKQLVDDTTALALAEGRKVGSVGHAKARKYLLDRCSDLQLAPFKGDNLVLPYKGNETNGSKSQVFYNIVASIPGKNSSLAPVLIGAHYDSVIAAPCADDNATSVALTLAIAEHFQVSQPEQDLIIAFFDAEEPPYFYTSKMGSTRFQEDHCSKLNFAAVIITDLIGHDLEIKNFSNNILLKKVASKVSNTLFLLGSESSSIFPDIISTVAQQNKKLRIVPTLNSYIGSMSDHHAFEQAGQPFIFLSCGQGKYYHHPLDDLEWINFDKLVDITLFVIQLIDHIIVDSQSKPEPCDPYEFEIKMLKKAIGPLYHPLLKLAGKKSPKTRSDLNHLIGELVTGLM